MINNIKLFQIQEATLLFVDNPVGTGFSYVDEDGAYTTDADQIADDLLAFFKHFLRHNPEFIVSVDVCSTDAV